MYLLHPILSVNMSAEIGREIEHQILLGGTGLDKQDRYLLEINVEDLESSSGEDQYYWLLATLFSCISFSLLSVLAACIANSQ